MARVNVYLPDELAAEVKEAGLNVSSITQDALRSELSSRRTDAWILELQTTDRKVGADEVLRAVRDARLELWGGD